MGWANTDVRQADFACRGIARAVHTHLERGRVGVGRDGNDNLDVVGRRAALKVTLGLDHVLHTAVRVTLNDAFDPDEGLDILRKWDVGKKDVSEVRLGSLDLRAARVVGRLGSFDLRAARWNRGLTWLKR